MDWIRTSTPVRDINRALPVKLPPDQSLMKGAGFKPATCPLDEKHRP